MTLKIAVIVGSTRPSRVGRKIADWFVDQVSDTPDVKFTLIDLADVNLPFLDESNLASMQQYQREHTKKWSKLIDSFDGYVFVTPEYNHGYPASLKNAIDYLYNEWARKPVAFVGYGALGGSATLEHLVPVVAQIGMVPLLGTSVKVIDVWGAFDEEGNFSEGNLRGSSPEKLMDNLVWWAKVLQKARAN